MVFISVSEGEGVVDGFAYENVDFMLFAFWMEELEMLVVIEVVSTFFGVIEMIEVLYWREAFQISVELLETFFKCRCCRLSAYVEVSEIRRLHNMWLLMVHQRY